MLHTLTKQLEERAMCDYSLKAVNSRPAKVGEQLVTTTFVGTSSRGFASPDDRSKAVCILPGTELRFEKRVQIVGNTPFEALDEGVKRVIGVTPRVGDLMATFTQVDKDNPHTHHDALKFVDGNIVKLTQLETEQTAIVLTLPAQPKTEAARQKQERVAVTA